MTFARFIASASLLVTLLTGPSAAQCGQGGVLGPPVLSTTSNLWDSEFELVLENAPAGAGLLILADVVPGPTPFPFGTLCTGPQPLIIANSFAFTAPFTDSTGAARIPGVFPPTLTAIIGLPLFLQAVVVDFTAPFNVGISNRLDLEVKSPRIFMNELQSGSTSTIVIRDAVSLSGFGPPPPGGPATITPPVQPPTAFGNSLFDVSRDGTRLLVQSFTNTASGFNVHLALYDLTATPPALVGTSVLPSPGGGFADAPPRFAEDGDSAFINQLGGIIARIDTDPASPSFLGVVAQTTVPTPTSVETSPDGAALFVQSVSFSSPFTEMITVLDTTTLATVATTPVPRIQPGGGTQPQLAVSGDGSVLVSIRPGTVNPAVIVAGEATVFDAASLTPLGLAPLAGTRQFRGAVFDPTDATNATLLFVELHNGVQRLARYDWIAATTTQSAPLPTNPSFAGCSTTPNGSFIFVADESGAPTSSLHVFDLSLALFNTIPTTSDGVGQIIVESR